MNQYGPTNLVRIQGDEVVPSYAQSCPYAFNSIWVGIGNSPLSQNGTAYGWDNSTGNSALFWEMLKPGYDTGMMFIYTTGGYLQYVGPGTKFHLVTYYYSGQMHFTWQFPSGVAISVTVTSLSGIPASSFWDGTQVEWINEAPTVGGTVSALQDYGSSSWSVAYSQVNNGTATPISGYPYHLVNMTVVGGTTIRSQVRNNALSSSTSFVTDWKHC